jgi:hypothetical protein
VPDVHDADSVRSVSSIQSGGFDDDDDDDDDDHDEGDEGGGSMLAGLQKALLRVARSGGGREAARSSERRLELPVPPAVTHKKHRNAQVAAAAREDNEPGLSLMRKRKQVRRCAIETAWAAAVRPGDMTQTRINTATPLKHGHPPKDRSPGAVALEGLLTHDFPLEHHDVERLVSTFFVHDGADGSNETNSRAGCRLLLGMLEAVCGAQPSGAALVTRVATTVASMLQSIRRPDTDAHSAVADVMTACNAVFGELDVPAAAWEEVRALNGDGVASGAGVGLENVHNHANELFDEVLRRSDAKLQESRELAAAETWGTAGTAASGRGARGNRQKGNGAASSETRTTTSATGGVAAAGVASRGGRQQQSSHGGTSKGSEAARTKAAAASGTLSFVVVLNADIQRLVDDNVEYGSKPLTAHIVSVTARGKLLAAMPRGQGAYPTFKLDMPANVTGDRAKAVPAGAALETLVRAGYADEDDALVRYTAYKHGIQAKDLAAKLRHAKTRASAAPGARD